jgi:uncharacterized membrane protein YbhN (UPF0104 family)
VFFAGWVLWGYWRGGGAISPGPISSGGAEQGLGWGWLVLGVPAALYAAWRIWRGSGHHRRWLLSRSGRRLRAEAHLFTRELKRQRRGMPLCILLHVLAWSLSGFQIWLAAQVFGLDLSLYGAFAIESAATGARAVLFFVPGGLVLQEAGAVLAGAAVGVAAPQALALSLVLRLRDVCFGVALLGWPWLEYRRKR